MRFAVNYSLQGAELWRKKLIQVDCFKCPAWSDLIDDINEHYPLYVHFPLRVGSGIGNAINTETKLQPDWQTFEKIAVQTQTPYFNVHLCPVPEDHPEIPTNELDFHLSEKLTAYMIQDINPLVERYGSDKVIAENIYSCRGEYPLAAIVPEVVSEVINETGCGLLLDISHARQAARELNMDPKYYISNLPLHRLRELHVTGIQVLDRYWIEMLQTAGIEQNKIQQYANQLMDHLPMIQEDWTFFQWTMEQIHKGNWPEPEIVAFEYSGIGKGFFQATTDTDILQTQIPRLYEMVHHNLESNLKHTLTNQ